MDDKFRNLFEIEQRIFLGAITPSNGRENYNGWIRAKDVEEAEGGEVRPPFYVNGAYPGDGPGGDNAHQGMIDIEQTSAGGIELHR